MKTQKYILPFLKPLYSSLSEPSLAIFRVIVGLFLVPHGAQKLFGVLGGGGLAGTSAFFESLGMPMPKMAALAAGSVEFFGGILLALGLLTRPAAAATTFLLFVAAYSVHFSNGFFNAKGGYEFAVLWMFATAIFIVRGGGSLSLDRVIGREF